ncbi:BamA/TamA family outer membrane protein, partial [Escherichia coli]|nr:BamA/TamA family outer membrane protein [Escherichia coli]
TRVLRLLGRSSWIRGIGDNHRGLFRLEGGANITDEFEKLSPSLRFFAGGDNNIRGYGYESISPVDESGALTGGKYIVSSTLEYQ